MLDQHTEPVIGDLPRSDAMRALKRRGLMAGAAALVTAAVARFAAQPAFAGVDGDVVLGGSNSSATATAITNSSGSDAVHGTTSAGVGVLGQTDTGYGLYGNATGSGYGVFGFSAGGFGVVGSSNSSVGLYGNSQTNFGLYGQSNSGIGLVGLSQSNVGLYGQSTNGNAGQFVGPLVVQGSFTATGIKSAAVKHPDGSMRRLYCLESTESYFEDFGRAQLKGGHISVDLDDDFAAVVYNEDYDVFLTPYGESRGLYVSKRTPLQFQVTEQRNGTSNIAFSYRVVARRRDVPRARLEKVEMPPVLKLPIPQPVQPSRSR